MLWKNGLLLRLLLLSLLVLLAPSSGLLVVTIRGSPPGRCASSFTTTTKTALCAHVAAAANANKVTTANSNQHENHHCRPIRVAVIGGGMAGLSFAQHLSSKNDPSSKDVKVTVFDTGRLRPGGRASSRLPGDVPKDDDNDKGVYPLLNRHVIDHAAQVITLPATGRRDDPRLEAFAHQVRAWTDEGVLTQFGTNGQLCRIIVANHENDNDDGPSPLNDDDHNKPPFRLVPLPSDPPNYFGTHGMGSIALHMCKQKMFDVHQDTWVSPSNGARYISSGDQQTWKLQASGRQLGQFDVLIIAHNGKCADRLMSKTPAKRIHRLLRVNFASSVPKRGGHRMTLNSIYSLTFCLPNEKNPLSMTLPPPFQAGYIQNEPSLRFLTCQTRKFATAYDKNNHHHDELQQEVWTVLSSPTFAKQHKAPQEFLPNDVVNNVTQLLLQGVERSLGFTSKSLTPLESRLQLWGAAVPLNVWHNGNDNGENNNNRPGGGGGAGFLYDAEYAVGVCGDWLVEPSIAGAWTSGRLLAEHVWKTITSSFNANTSVGLEEGHFCHSDKVAQAGIGALSTSSSKPSKKNRKRKNKPRRKQQPSKVLQS